MTNPPTETQKINAHQRGTIIFPRSEKRIECSVWISRDGGGRVSCPNIKDLPKRFELLLHREGATAIKCERIWIVGPNAGVRFQT